MVIDLKLANLEVERQRLIALFLFPIDCPPRGEKNRLWHRIETLTSRKERLQDYRDRISKATIH